MSGCVAKNRGKKNIECCAALLYFCLMLFMGGTLVKQAVYVAMVLTFLLLGFFIYRRKCVIVAVGKYLFSGIICTIAAFSTMFIGIDKGESIFGFWRIILILAMALLVLQLSEDTKRTLFLSLPIIAVIMSVIAFLNGRLPGLEEYLTDNGRLAGAFHYANTMGLFLLFGFAVVTNLYPKNKFTVIFYIVLPVGILMTGSRSTFLLMLGYLIYRLIKVKGRDKLIPLIFFMILVFGLIALLTSNDKTFGRFLTIALETSTLQGRLLYWMDGLKMMLRHPFGLGYMGYFYLQQADQTGFYSVRFVHNEWLQTALDYGVIVLFVMIFIITEELLGKEQEKWKKEMLVLLSFHCVFDFDLQYISIVFILLLLLEYEPYKNVAIAKGKKYYFIGQIVISAIMARFFMGDYFIDNGEYHCAVLLNPYSAEYLSMEMLAQNTLNEAFLYTDKIIELNPCLYVPYKMKAHYYAERKELELVVQNMKKVLSLRKYRIEEYEEYLVMLSELLQYYEASGHKQSMNRCIQYIVEVPELLNSVKVETSVLAYKISDKPNLLLKAEYQRFIDQFGKQCFQIF